MSHAGVSTEFVELKVSDGTLMQAYVARPAAGGAHPGLLVFQEAYGVNGHIRNVAERSAAEGYLAIAPELFHRTAPAGFTGPYGDFEAVRPHTQAVTNETAEQDVRAAYEWLRSDKQVKADSISCVGFCMGGRISFLTNSILPLRAAVSFYGGGIAQTLIDRAAKQHAPILLMWGGLDKHITGEHRRALTEALTAEKKDFVNVEFAQADHGFFCDERSSYNPIAARQAWALTLEFLRS